MRGGNFQNKGGEQCVAGDYMEKGGESHKKVMIKVEGGHTGKKGTVVREKSAVRKGGQGHRGGD